MVAKVLESFRAVAIGNAYTCKVAIV